MNTNNAFIAAVGMYATVPALGIISLQEKYNPLTSTVDCVYCTLICLKFIILLMIGFFAFLIWVSLFLFQYCIRVC